MSAGTEPLGGFLELLLRDVAADLMGECAWREHVQHPPAGMESEGLSQRPAHRFALDGAVCDSRQT